jgi:hypothetical protein
LILSSLFLVSWFLNSFLFPGGRCGEEFLPVAVFDAAFFDSAGAAGGSLSEFALGVGGLRAEALS